jgi:hypothetical protein
MEKRAYCDIDDEILPRVIPVLADHGLKLVSARRQSSHTLRAMLEGDALPDDCADEIKLVTISIHRTTYGRQKMDRVERIDIVG